MADTMIRVQPDGTEETWYSEEYVKRQIDNAFRAGLFRGGKVQILSVQPMDGRMVDDLSDEFRKRIDEEYIKDKAESVEQRLRSAEFHESMRNPTYRHNMYKGNERTPQYDLDFIDPIIPCIIIE